MKKKKIKWLLGPDGKTICTKDFAKVEALVALQVECEFWRALLKDK